jgi:tRNA A-37 threonylcarbamoyl transferase component Bud32
MRGFRSRSLEFSLPPSLDRGVLTEALQTAVELYELGDVLGLRWTIDSQINGRSSVVFPLRLFPNGRTIAAYYKTSSERHQRKVEPGLARSREFTPALAALCRQEAITVPHLLAVRPETLTIVTSAIPGRPLGAAFTRTLTAGRRRLAVDACHRIGRAVRLIEQVASPDEPVLDTAEWSRVDRALERARRLLSVDASDSLRARLAESHDAALSSGIAVYSHGDLSGTNVLVTSTLIGLIDFQWQVKWAGYDLAVLACRMRNHPAVSNRWASALIDAMTDGYGDRRITSSPAWAYYTLRRTLRLALKNPKRSPWYRHSIRRAREQLMARTST